MIDEYDKLVEKIIKALHDCGVYKATFRMAAGRNDMEALLNDVEGALKDADGAFKLVAMIAVGGATTTMLNSGLDLEPHQFAKLADYPDIKELGEQVLLCMVVALARGRDLDSQWRTLVDLWAQQRLNKHPNWYKHKRRGRPNEEDKAVSVAIAYHMKLKKHPSRKQDSIVAELEREFGLKRRRILEIIEGVNRRMDKPN